jgi:peptidoglycan hydrolase CwlO-like protein
MNVRVIEMKTKLEEKIKALEKERSIFLEEVKQLKEIVELSEKAKDLENEVNKLRKEVAALKDKIPREFLEELDESKALREEEQLG